MKTLQLPSRERNKMQSSSIENTTAQNSVFFDKETSEIILRKLKEKAELEEKRKEINQFIINIALFVSIGLFFIYLKFTLS